MNLKSHCPIHFALEHIGDRWSLLILRDLMFKGKRHYNEFFDSEEKISTTVLVDRLKRMEAHGILSSGTDPVKKSRIRYSLTQKGIDLLPLLVDMILWGATYDPKTAAEKSFTRKAGFNRKQLISELTRGLKKDHLN